VKKSWRIIVGLFLGLILIGTAACSIGQGGQATQQLVKVERGDLTVTVSSSGNLELVNDSNLTFGIGGRVDKIYVKEGDNVSKGELLASLETDSLKLAVTQAQVAYSQAQSGVTQAQVALDTANYNLDQALGRYTWPDIETAQADVDDTKAYVEYASKNLSQASPQSAAMWQATLAFAQARLAAAEARLNAMITNYDTPEVAIKRSQVEVAQQALDLARQSVELAKQTLQQSQGQLDKAAIRAPFDGVIAKVNVDEGDTVSPAMPIIRIVDPRTAQLTVQVDEIDVATVEVGQRAKVTFDALPGIELTGKVKSISLLPADQAGVVVYDVKVSIDMAQGTGPRPGMSTTADIVTAERHDVLLVPERAITRDSQEKATVEVMSDGQIETRTIVTGISDGLQTEVLEGLSEGETVVERRTQSSASGGLF
jgi:HlyD family secretion protein